MLTVSFENRGKTGLCDFLYGEIKNQILNKTLKADEKLPSKRALSQNLGISVITVQNAYSRLISEGYIYSEEKKGFFVMNLLPLKPREVTLKESSNTLHEKRKTEYFADFKSNAVSYEKFPFNQWSRVMRSVLSSRNEQLLMRSDCKGVFELRKAISSYIREFRGMNVLPEQIVIGSGTENLYALLVELLGQNRLYAVENPGYKKIYSLLELNGASCIPVSIDEHGINVSRLEKSNANVVHVSPNHHFPTGIVMPVKKRQELLSWASAKEKCRKNVSRYIIEDDFDSEFRFNGKPLETLFSMDVNDSVIYVNTFSKTLSPSFRIGFMVLPPKLMNEFEKKFSFYSCSVSIFEQYTLARFIYQGYYSSHIIRMRNWYRNLRNAFIGELYKSKIKECCSVFEEDAGLHFLLTCRETKKRNALEIKQELLENQNINISLLSEYFYGKVPEKFLSTFVVNYSGIKKERITEIVNRLENVFV